MTGLLLAAAGGAIGAGLRFGIGQLAAARFPYSAHWVTLLINLTGSFALGVMYGFDWPSREHEAYLFAGTGILGGYTTFSTLQVQTVLLTGERAFSTAAALTALTYIAGLALAAAGYALGRLLPPG